MPVITHKCPNCAGRLEFESTAQRMRCPYCDSEFDVQALLAAEAAAAAQGASQPPPPDPDSRVRVDWMLPSKQWAPEEQQDMFVYTCSTCAGQLASDATLGAAECPYCGNPIVITDRLSGGLKPDLIIPFKLNKDAAREALRKHYEGRPFLPKLFTQDSTLDEIKGIYVPFWLFDATIDANAVYSAEKHRSYSDSQYDYTETEHYQVHRSGQIEFLHVPVDGSQRIPDELMESIEPFAYQDLVPFSTPYLAGYSTNIYDVDAPTAIPRAQQRMVDTAREVLRTSVEGFSNVQLTQLDVAYDNPRCSYALLPVWMMSKTFEGKVYTFAMNGQTGRLVGDLPVDKSLRWRSFFMTMGIVWLAIFAIALIVGLAGG